MNTSRKGFTLIELLVVIAIIALLLSILVPSLQIAKERARRIVCSNRLKNLALALNLYAQDYNGHFPGYRITGGGPNVQNISFSLLKDLSDNYDTLPEYVFCPTWAFNSDRKQYIKDVQELIRNADDDALETGSAILGYHLWTPRYHGPVVSDNYQIPPAYPQPSGHWAMLNPRYNGSWIGPAKVSDKTAQTVPIMTDRVQTRRGSSPVPGPYDTLDPAFMEEAYLSHYDPQQGVEVNNQVYADTHIEVKKQDELVFIYAHNSAGGPLCMWR